MEQLMNKRIIIRSLNRGNRLRVVIPLPFNKDDKIQKKRTYKVTTDFIYSDSNSIFILEEPSPTLLQKINPELQSKTIMIRLDGTNLYLTHVMYNDKARNDMMDSLLSILPMMIPEEVASHILDFAIDCPSNESSFEGSGYNYHPMTALWRGRSDQDGDNGLNGETNLLQCFHLESLPNRNRSNGYGVKSVFGTYWRDQWWSNTISQSPICAGDEMFTLKITE